MGVGDILQPTHLLFILVVALLVLGPKRLPEVGRSLGSGLRDFRAAISGEPITHDEPTQQVAQPAYVEPIRDPVAAAAPVAAPDPVPTAVLDPDPVAESSYEPENSYLDLSEDAGSEPSVQAPASGFASALAATRQRPATSGEPASGDDPAHE